MKRIRNVVLILVAIVSVGMLKVPAFAGNHMHLPITDISFSTEPSLTEKGVLSVSYTVPEHEDGDTYYSAISLYVYNSKTGAYFTDGIWGGYTDVLSAEQLSELSSAAAGTVFSGTFNFDEYIFPESTPDGIYVIDIYDNSENPIYSKTITIGTPSNDSGNNTACGGDKEDTKTKTVEKVPVETAAERYSRLLEEKINNEKNTSVDSFISNGAVAAIPNKVKNSETTYNLSNISTILGYSSAINKVAQNSLSSKNIQVYTEKPMVFNTFTKRVKALCLYAQSKRCFSFDWV